MDASATETVSNSTRDASPAEVAVRDGAASAVRHGLTAKKFLPSELRPGRVQEIFERLSAEMPLHSQLAALMLREAARHAAILETVEGGEWAVQRLASAGLASLVAAGGGMTGDTALAAAVTAEPLERVNRYRRTHEKGLYAAIERFLALNKLPVSTSLPVSASADNFATVAACEEILRQRFAAPSWRCPSCGRLACAYVARLKKWRCAACGQHVRLREGTIFARSAIALPIWFRAVAVVAKNLEITADDLAKQLGMTRVATVRTMRTKIYEAFTSGALPVPFGVVAKTALLRNETFPQSAFNNVANLTAERL